MYEDEDNNGKFPHESPVELAVVHGGRRDRTARWISSAPYPPDLVGLRAGAFCSADGVLLADLRASCGRHRGPRVVVLVLAVGASSRGLAAAPAG